MIHITPLLLVGLAYVVGATPSSYWLGRRAYGVDLRSVGSGNLGATNTYRVLGMRAAVPVVLLDILKGWAPVALFPRLAPDMAFGWTLAYGTAAIVGHVYSFWVGFRGGKGVATGAGVLMALAPLALLAALGVWIVTVLATGYVSLASVLGAAVLPLVMITTPHQHGLALFLFTAGLAAFVIWTHRENLRRLGRGEEPRVRNRTPGEGSA